MADELVGAFYGAAAYVVSASFCRAVVESLPVFAQVLECRRNLLFGFGRRGDHALDTGQDLSLLVVEKPSQSGFDPFSALTSVFTVLRVGQGIEVFGAMVVIQGSNPRFLISE